MSKHSYIPALDRLYERYDYLRDIINEIDDEMIEFELQPENEGRVFLPEPSEQLNYYNALIDEFDALQKLCYEIRDLSKKYCPEDKKYWETENDNNSET